MQPNPVPRWRTVLGLIAAAILALVVTVLALRVPAEADQGTQQIPPHEHSTSFTPHTKRQVAFHDDLRKLWEDHITWTRLAIVAFADGSAGFDATAGRLLANQTDLGNAVKPYYGNAAGDRLTALLREHILIAVEILQAAKAGDTAAFEAARARWYANSDQISDFLSAANPRFWPRAEMRAAMRAHLDQTLTEAAHELAKDYPASVADYEQVHAHILAMADFLSAGIMQQFPAQFR